VTEGIGKWDDFREFHETDSIWLRACVEDRLFMRQEFAVQFDSDEHTTTVSWRTQ
jgi:hypothetical protein